MLVAQLPDTQRQQVPCKQLVAHSCCSFRPYRQSRRLPSLSRRRTCSFQIAQTALVCDNVEGKTLAFVLSLRPPTQRKILTSIPAFRWGVLFRDRIISIGVRRSLQVDFDPSWSSSDDPQRIQEQHLLQADDFSTELGQSPVHGLDTQLRIVDLLNCTCRLVHSSSRPLKVLYNYEGRLQTET